MERVRVVVYPPTAGGGRRVRVDGRILGLARSDAELYELLFQHGIAAALDDPGLIECDLSHRRLSILSEG
jgi:hypothetical protein